MATLDSRSSMEREDKPVTASVSNFGPETPASWKVDNALRQLAYRYWVERGHPIGSPEVDWYRAEQKIRTVMLDADVVRRETVTVSR